MKVADLKCTLIFDPNFIPKYKKGDKIGRATITGYAGYKAQFSGGKNRKRHHYYYDCSCGSTHNIVQQDVLDRAIKRNYEFSCGCVSVERCKTELLYTDFKTRYHNTRYNRQSPIHAEYKNMCSRCNGEANTRYNSYGARGIKVADEWLGGEGYNRFCDWMYDEAGYTEGKELGHKFNLNRCDNDGPYAPWNCYIASNDEQCNNKSTSFEIDWYGQRYTIKEFSDKFQKVPTSFRTKYIEQGHSIHECIFGPKFINQFDRKEYIQNSPNGLVATPRAFVIYPFQFVDHSNVLCTDPRRNYEHYNHEQALNVMDYVERKHLAEQGTPVKPFRFTNSGSTDFLLYGRYQ